jgi:hypothetical protein
MISLNNTFVFVHVNKTGGTSITEAFADYEDPLHPDYDHLCAKLTKRLIGADLWEEMYSFAFFRNPFDRMVSSYFYRRQILEDTRCSRPAKDKSFRDWMLEDVASFHYCTHGHEWNNQLAMVEEGDGNVIVDDIFFFEDGLQKGLDTACNKIGISVPELIHSNKTEKAHWSSYYDEETREIVAERFSRDLLWAEEVRPGIWPSPLD